MILLNVKEKKNHMLHGILFQLTSYGGYLEFILRHIPTPGSEPTVGSPLIEIQVYLDIFLLQVQNLLYRFSAYRDTDIPIYIPTPGSEPTVGSPLIEIQVYPYIFLLHV